MNVNELRFGNLIFDKDGEILEVSEITKVSIHSENKYSLIGTPKEWCKPIPLTEEMLLKCGFNKIYDSQYDMYEYYITYSDGMGYSVTYFFSEGCLTFIDYREIPIAQGIQNVHQLQDLYFALTQEELIVNL